MKKNEKLIIYIKKKALFKHLKKKKKRNLSKSKFLIKTIIIFFLSILFSRLIKTINEIEVFKIQQFFTTKIRTNSILLFEKNYFHYECTPGFVKYFLDLGFNVDIIMTEIGNETFIFFEKTKKLRFFKLNDSIYYTSDEYIEKFRKIFTKYLAILVQTMTPDINKFYNNTNLLKGKNSIFVYHYHPEMPWIDFHNKFRSWTLLNFTNLALGVNPHYFGKIKSRNKNIITRFFIASTPLRNYDKLIYSCDKLNNENFKFQIIVTGRNKILSEGKIPTNIKDKFVFNHFLSYLDLMKVMETIDFIIITLEQNNPGDITYINGRSTGSAQLSYGFLKPCLINSYFSKTYGMNNENSLIFNDSKDSLYFAMRDAIMMTNKEYKKKQYHLKKYANKLYEISKKNVKTTINYILNS